MKDKKMIIIYGAPGAGKDTQAEKIADKFGFFQIKMSSILKDKLNNPALQDDPKIKEEKDKMSRGELIDEGWTTELVKEEVERRADEKGLIMNGFPRTLSQAENSLLEWEKSFGKENIIILNIKIKLETAVSRNTQRKECKNCNKLFGYLDKQPNCPDCGGDLLVRIDDSEEVIRNRFKIQYSQVIDGLFGFFNDRGYKILDVDGEKLPNEVTEQIFNSLNK